MSDNDPLIDRFNGEVDDALALHKFQQSEPTTIGWSVSTGAKTQRKYLITRESDGTFKLHSALQVAQLEILPEDIETIAELNQKAYNAIRALHMKAFQSNHERR